MPSRRRNHSAFVASFHGMCFFNGYHLWVLVQAILSTFFCFYGNLQIMYNHVLHIISLKKIYYTLSKVEILTKFQHKLITMVFLNLINL